MRQPPAARRQLPPDREVAAVATENLTKRFGAVEAVRGITFDVRPGESFALLGPNGAGKSTTIRILCTLTRPSGGRATVAGFDVARDSPAVRRRIGLVFQDQTLDQQLTAEENLRFHAVLYGVPSAEVRTRIDRVLALLELSPRRRDLVATYSGGMARRLEIARALIHAPEVLFLDEPTAGLDPQARARMWADVGRFRAEEGTTVFFTTHYMDEAEYADRIAIIDHGSIVALDTAARLKAAVAGDVVTLVTADGGEAAARLREVGFDARPADGRVEVRVADGDSAVAPLVVAAGVPVHQVRVSRPSLDDVFLHFTGRDLRDGGETEPSLRRFMAGRRR